MTRTLPSVTLLILSGLLAGCGNSQLTTGSIPEDYRARHPIVLTEAQSALDIPVAPSDYRLSTGMRDTVKGFAQKFVQSSSGYVQIQLPQGSPNAAAASHLARDIRTVLSGSGIRSDRIIMTAYGAAPSGDAAPIRLSFASTRAVTASCGNWPEDLSNDTMENRNWYNFGCASQNNLAAQVANPTDLMAPRGMTPIDATRRANVIGAYRAGTDPSSK
ncbi:CpaD family pilus assembly protein [Rhizobium oryzicola]|uniref:CpaD family pilus assembly protein n=1 Tax=Rhizobium oryzicola TaxID=1232668 RepID=A0ABT8SRK0_9HYPH|nr:CpaD family pilus assembly protein [Rhizobium oryzicola]MDO1580653.1 CpaD family pilus assembly protein [Rhizobium oryzicola]